MNAEKTNELSPASLRVIAEDFSGRVTRVERSIRETLNELAKINSELSEHGEIVLLLMGKLVAADEAAILAMVYAEDLSRAIGRKEPIDDGGF